MREYQFEEGEMRPLFQVGAVKGGRIVQHRSNGETLFNVLVFGDGWHAFVRTKRGKLRRFRELETATRWFEKMGWGGELQITLGNQEEDG